MQCGSPRCLDRDEAFSAIPHEGVKAMCDTTDQSTIPVNSERDVFVFDGYVLVTPVAPTGP